MLFCIPRVSNVSMNLNLDWFMYHVCCKYRESHLGFVCYFFLPCSKKKQTTGDCRKGELRDHLKMFSSLYVFGLWLLVFFFYEQLF